MPSAKVRTFDVKSIAVLGAGPSGVAAAKYLLAERAFSRVDIFEQRARVGGVWDYDPNPKSVPKEFHIPQTSPHAGLATPIWQQGGTKRALGSQAKDEAAFLSPLYDRLETNIPRTLMGFSDLDWPQDSQLFPKHETVTQYIERYAQDVKHLIKFRTQVVSVKPATRDDATGGWLVRTRSINQNDNGNDKEEHYDAVVVASGHFNVPFVPNIKGLSEWAEQYPGAVSHSMYYKKPEDYEGKKVVCVGNGASGIDIATQIMSTCKWPLIQSQRSDSFALTDPSPSKHDRPEIVEFIPSSRGVKFADGSTEEYIDNILFCTGYFYSFPFLDTLDPPLITDGTHVQNLYQHLLYRPNPTLAFPTLQQRIIPFPMAEAQSAVLARLWNNRISLPSTPEMAAWESSRQASTGGGRDFHLLKFPADAEYINAMHDWAMSADDILSDSTSNHNAQVQGKEPPHWGEKEFWMRERFPSIKKAFHDKGDDRVNITTMEQLGFDFEEWKRDKATESKTLL